MIAVRVAPEITRSLAVLIDLGPDGEATIITDAADNVEHAEALARLRAWCAGAAVDGLLAELGEGGDQR